MITLRRMLVAATGVLVAASVLGAQAPRAAQRHEGFFIGFGLGGSRNDLKCTGCNFTGDTDPWRGGLGNAFTATIGGALSQQLLLGGELSAAAVMGASQRSASVGSLLFVAQYYPGAFDGFHVKGGLGPAGVVLKAPGAEVKASGFAAQLGAGYDFRVGRRFAITPYANVARTAIQQGSIKTTGSAGAVTELDNRIITQFGVSFNWY